tara:strand:+ start:141 stop:371 length:231 start_codon:yes stop_codon:yes gene_type:complete
MTASNIIMEKTKIAAVSKDGSFLSLTDAKIKSASKAGLMAYIKKSEYGTASIEATNIQNGGRGSICYCSKRKSYIY